jgi:non-ribosomal peptide synthetase component E (peptide arylation enzyme)
MKGHAGNKTYAEWQLPEVVLFVDAIPNKTSIGKIDKKAIRKQEEFLPGRSRYAP